MSGVTGAGLTWAQVPGAQVHAKAFPAGGTFGLVEAWYASAPSGWAAQAITVMFSEVVANTSGNVGIIQPIVFTGAATTQNGAVGTVSSGAPSQAVTTTANGSWVLAAGDTNAGNTAPTAGSAQTTTINGNVSVETGTGINGAWWVQRQNAATSTSGTSVTMNDTAPSGSTNFLAVEILAAVGGGAAAPVYPVYLPRWLGPAAGIEWLQGLPPVATPTSPPPPMPSRVVF